PCQCEWNVHRRMAALRLLLVRRGCEVARAGARCRLEDWPGASPGIRDQRPGRGHSDSLQRRAAATRWIHDLEARVRPPSCHRPALIRCPTGLGVARVWTAGLSGPPPSRSSVLTNSASTGPSSGSASRRVIRLNSEAPRRVMCAFTDAVLVADGLDPLVH